LYTHIGSGGAPQARVEEGGPMCSPFVITPFFYEEPAVAVSSKQFTKTGFGFNLMVGKEWWVSDNWGLGVALQLLLAGAKDRDGTEWDSGALAVLFTATHN
jgi:hypothetical protein